MLITSEITSGMLDDLLVKLRQASAYTILWTGVLYTFTVKSSDGECLELIDCNLWAKCAHSQSVGGIKDLFHSMTNKSRLLLCFCFWTFGYSY